MCRSSLVEYAHLEQSHGNAVLVCPSMRGVRHPHTRWRRRRQRPSLALTLTLTLCEAPAHTVETTARAKLPWSTAAYRNHAPWFGFGLG